MTCAGIGTHMLRLCHMPAAAGWHGASARARQNPCQRFRHQGVAPCRMLWEAGHLAPSPLPARITLYAQAFHSGPAVVWQSAKVNVADVEHVLVCRRTQVLCPVQGGLCCIVNKATCDLSSDCLIRTQDPCTLVVPSVSNVA